MERIDFLFGLADHPGLDGFEQIDIAESRPMKQLTMRRNRFHERSRARAVQEYCSNCGGIHYGSYKCPYTRKEAAAFKASFEEAQSPKSNALPSEQPRMSSSSAPSQAEAPGEAEI